jgi:hypothetical protein
VGGAVVVVVVVGLELISLCWLSVSTLVPVEAGPVSVGLVVLAVSLGGRKAATGLRTEVKTSLVRSIASDS